MNNSQMVEVLIVGQFPPPVNGFSYVTQEMAKLLSFRHEVVSVDLRSRVTGKGITYYLDRLRLALRGCLAIGRRALGRDKAQVYFACDGGFGIAYFLILASVARIANARTYLHHHNFSYIDKRYSLMALLLKIMGPRVTHIFLSDEMGKKFAARYKRHVEGITLSNSAFVAPVSESGDRAAKASPGTLVIGLLSNLNEEKGLYLFLETLRQALARNMNVKAILAGPAERDADRQAIQAAQAEFGSRLDYRGPVYDESKLAFYRDIDVFLFPTCYANEAQPTVVFEAMAHGVPSLSYDRGCIKDQIGMTGAVAEQRMNFPEFALEFLKQWENAPQILDSLKMDAKNAFLGDRARSCDIAANLLSQRPQIYGQSP